MATGNYVIKENISSTHKNNQAVLESHKNNQAVLESHKNQTQIKSGFFNSNRKVTL